MYNYGGGYNYDYNQSAELAKVASNGAGAIIWICIAAFLAFVGGIIAYYLFVKPDKKHESNFLNKLKEFLRFKTMLIEGLLKVFYVIAALFTTLSAFAWFAIGFLGVLFFLIQITLGNVLTRIMYESMLLKIMIWKNTKEINEKVK